jgi:hypothetical protein
MCTVVNNTVYTTEYTLGSSGKESDSRLLMATRRHTVHTIAHKPSYNVATRRYGMRRHARNRFYVRL